MDMFVTLGFLYVFAIVMSALKMEVNRPRTHLLKGGG